MEETLTHCGHLMIDICDDKWPNYTVRWYQCKVCGLKIFRSGVSSLFSILMKHLPKSDCEIVMIEEEYEVRSMPDRDGKGPRKRSPRPSRSKGGRGKGKC